MPELNPALQDIQELLTPPDLTEHEWKIVEKAKSFILATCKPELRQELEEQYTKREIEFRDKLTQENKEFISQYMEDWKKTQTPLTSEEIQKMLSHQYEDFSFPYVDKRTGKEYKFTIQELPIDIEEKFIKLASSELIPLIEEYMASEFVVDGTVADHVKVFLHKLPRGLNIACELAAVCLDPWKENKEITADWVKAHMSISRVEKILLSQSEANRYRDFFSSGFQLFQNMKRT